MSNSFNCVNPQPPCYSGVTINISNPALNMPHAGVNGSNSAPYNQMVQCPACGMYSAEGMYCQSVPQGVNLSPCVSNPYQQIPVATLPAQEGYSPIPQGGYYGSYYGVQNLPAQPGAFSEHTGRDYNSGTQNINNTNIYQTVPSDGRNYLPQSYPSQYYLNGYENSPAVNEPAYLSEEENNTNTSEALIRELDERNAEEKAVEQNGKKTKVVALTNEYIMSLENYLNNPNTDIRLMASKEILTRLDEDRSRYDDAALNALLNKMLQDPSKLVRIAAMSALSSELASGNDYTVELLTRIQQNPEADPEDVLEASQILLKRASSTEVRYTYDNQYGAVEE